MFFDLHETTAASGFYKHHGKGRLVVPLHGSNEFLVRGGDRRMKIEPASSHVAQWEILGSAYGGLPGDPTGEGAVVRVYGVGSGTSEFTIRQGHEHRALIVYVFRRRVVRVNFWFVRDQRFQTARQASWCRYLLDRLNFVYEAQVNVTFKQNKPPQLLQVPEIDFSRPVQDSTQETALWETLRSKLPPGGGHRLVWNVFFVADWGGHDCNGRDAIGTNPIGDNLCIIEDSISGRYGKYLDSLVLAHEAGHFLGLQHPHHPKDYLMYPDAGFIGDRLVWNDVKTVLHKLK
jgi:hypothetical protein